MEGSPLQDWDAVFQRTSRGLAAACVAVEDVAEELATALISVASALS